MAIKYCCKSPVDNKWKSCTEASHDALPANRRCMRTDGTDCTKCESNNTCDNQDNEKLNAGFKKTNEANYRSAKSKPNQYEVTYFYCKSDNKNHLFIKNKTVDPDPLIDTCSAPSTGFVSVDQSTKFRDFLHKYYPEIETKHDIWVSTDPRLKRIRKPYDTCSIRKSYAERDEKDPNKQAIGNLFGLWLQNNDALTWLDPKNDFNTPEGQEYSWETLIKNKQIWSKGVIVPAGGKKVYVIKTDIDNDKIKYQLNAAELKSPDLTKFDYLVLYPIDLSKKNSVGQLGVLFKSVDQDGNEVIKIKKQPTWSWTPAEVEEGLELQEQVINKGIADNPNVGVNTPSGINKGTSGSNKGSDVRTNIGKDLSTNGSSNNGTNNSGNTSLDKKITETPKTKEELRMFFGFVDDEGVTYDPKQRIIKMSQNPSQGEFGKGDLQNAIDNFSARSFYFDEYNDLMGMEGLEDKYKLKLPQGSPNAGKVITKDNVSELAPFRGDASKQFKQLTFGDFLNTTSPKATIDVESGKGSSDKSVGCSCKLRPDEVFDKLTNYIIAGLTGDESQSPDREGAGKEFCGCFKTGAFDQYIGRRGLKIDVTDLTGVSKTRLPKSLLNGKLDWDEIVMLMRGGKVSDVSMATTFHIPTFGDPNCRCLNTNTLRESIKGHISKAINSKKEVLKEERVIKSILSKIRQQGK
jgi:hypothetical protein